MITFFLFQVFTWITIIIATIVAIPILYLCIISISAIITAHQRQAVQQRAPLEVTKELPHFAILIPAHNEEVLLGQLLKTLLQLDYPAERYSIYLVADNCTDSTTTVAHSYTGVHVYERIDNEKRGKGYALHWIMQQLEAEGHIHDAYLILDADSVVATNYLHALSQELAKGGQALQGHNTVLNTTASPSTILRWVALTLVNHIRPLGRTGIGGSASINGNGFCLSRTLLERFPWQSYSLTEDYHYYLSLIQNGERIHYVPEAQVRSHMPTTFSQLQTQDIRWESQGERGSTPTIAWQLLKVGLRRLDIVRLDALAELLTPPLSFLVGSSLVITTLTFLLQIPLLIGLSLFLLGGLGLYIASALYLLRLPLAAYRALLYAPGFMLWKLWVYFVLSRRKKYTSQWIRTSRPKSTT